MIWLSWFLLRDIPLTTTQFRWANGEETPSLPAIWSTARFRFVILRLVCLQTTTQSKLARPGADCSNTFARRPPYCARRTLPRPRWAGLSAAEERLTLSRFQVDRLGDTGSADPSG